MLGLWDLVLENDDPARSSSSSSSSSFLSSVLYKSLSSLSDSSVRSTIDLVARLDICFLPCEADLLTLISRCRHSSIMHPVASVVRWPVDIFSRTAGLIVCLLVKAYAPSLILWITSDLSRPDLCSDLLHPLICASRWAAGVFVIVQQKGQRTHMRLLSRTPRPDWLNT